MRNQQLPLEEGSHICLGGQQLPLEDGSRANYFSVCMTIRPALPAAAWCS